MTLVISYAGKLIPGILRTRNIASIAAINPPKVISQRNFALSVFSRKIVRKAQEDKRDISN
jgi:hypothetical protein